MRLQFGNNWMKLKGTPGSGICGVISNLKDGEPSGAADDAEMMAAFDGVESLMLALYDHGIFQHANLTQVQQALLDTVDAIANHY